MAHQSKYPHFAEQVYSEKDLVREFESLLKDLRNKEHDAWLKRNAALRTIQVRAAMLALVHILQSIDYKFRR